MALFAKIAFGLAAGYGLLLLGLYFGQRSLIYRPDPRRVTPLQAGLANVTERILKTADGSRLIAWQAAAAAGRPTILYFHGNAGNLSTRAERIGRLQAKGWGVFMLSYRGYGGSSGKPSETANLKDAELALTTLNNEGIATRDIVLFGESLGTGIATQLAARHQQVAGLILNSPFTSMADAAAYHYPWVWVRPFIVDRYDTRSIIAKVACPILILHGEQDRVVPIAMGRELARIAKTRGTGARVTGSGVKLVTYAKGEHMDLDSYGALRDVNKFIESLKRPRNIRAAQ